MSISTVKNNMYQSYTSCGSLESDLNQLIDILNSVEDSNVDIVSEHISNIDYSMDTVKSNFDQMLQVNKAELHILFKEFNSKTSDMICELDTLSSELDSLSSMAEELYMQYILGIFTEGDLSVDDLREFIPNIVEVKNELQVFKMMIDEHNNKLIIGVRR